MVNNEWMIYIAFFQTILLKAVFSLYYFCGVNYSEFRQII